jgi:hypothetical protein
VTAKVAHVTPMTPRELYRCSFKFILEVGLEELIVNAPRITDLQITDQLFKYNLTFCVVCVFLCRLTSAHVYWSLININELLFIT